MTTGRINQIADDRASFVTARRRANGRTPWGRERRRCLVRSLLLRRQAKETTAAAALSRCNVRRRHPLCGLVYRCPMQAFEACFPARQDDPPPRGDGSTCAPLSCSGRKLARVAASVGLGPGGRRRLSVDRGRVRRLAPAAGSAGPCQAPCASGKRESRRGRRVSRDREPVRAPSGRKGPMRRRDPSSVPGRRLGCQCQAGGSTALLSRVCVSRRRPQKHTAAQGFRSTRGRTTKAREGRSR